MKFYETHFEEYINENNKMNLHPKLDKLYVKFPKQISDFKNLIFYGPSGVGKYTQMLRVIKIYSPTELKYEKKLSVVYNRQQLFFKISDIHYEIDMSLLGCNSKLLWHEIYLQIVDIIMAKTDKVGIIVCKNFHEIHSELLENFYSYMQKNNVLQIDLKFIIITKELTFIPDNILNCCEIIHIPRPTATNYLKCVKNKMPTNIKLENITNIKNLNLYNDNLMMSYKIISNKIIDNIINYRNIHFMKFRDLLYDLLIYNLDITDSIWYILNKLIKKKLIKEEHIGDIMIKTYCFFQYYNNNYRPIYHLENYFLNIIKKIHHL
jgi:DNA polymerase III delta prime subunit